MNFNGHAQKVIDEAKKDIKSRFTVSWKGFTTATAIIFILGIVWQASGFVQTQKDTTKLANNLKKKVQTLQIEKAVGDTINEDYLKFIVRKLEPDREKADAYIAQMEKRKADLIKELKKQLKNEDP